MPSSIAFIVLNYNGLADTLACLESFRAVQHAGMQVVVVDNASTEDPTEAIAAGHPEVQVIRHPTNAGWAGGNNVGLRWAMEKGFDVTVLLNNDTVVAPGIADRLMAAFAAHPSIGILGPVINRLDQWDMVMTDGCRFNLVDQPGFLTRQVIELTHADPPEVVPTDIVNGCCLAVRRDVLDRIGLIDERFFLIHEESDFCLRAQAAGWGVGIVAESLVWHKQHGTFSSAGKFWQRYYDARNMALLLAKHGGAGEGRRGRWAGWFEYVKYVYYWYCLAKDEEDERASDAVLEGILDAAAARFGPMPQRPRLLLPATRALFSFMRWARGAGANDATRT